MISLDNDAERLGCARSKLMEYSIGVVRFNARNQRMSEPGCNVDVNVAVELVVGKEKESLFGVPGHLSGQRTWTTVHRFSRKSCETTGALTTLY